MNNPNRLQTAIIAEPLRCRTRVLFLLVGLLWASGLRAQTAEEHASHHPGGAAGPGMATDAPGAGGMGGMMGGPGGMGGMMVKMGAPQPRDLYPTLMGLPDLPPEKRADVKRQAQGRMQSGTALMSQGLGQLSTAASTENFPAMQEGVQMLKEGLSQFDSGLAAHRALAEGKAPRNVALQWFKREMNLLPPSAGIAEERLGGPAFHLAVIAILGAFAAMMIWMYFHKMRRASALLKNLAGAGVAASPAQSSPPIKERESAHAASAQPETQSKPASPPSAPVPAVPPKFPAMKSRTEPVEKWTGKLRVCRIFQETPEVKTFRLAAEHDVALPFTYFPGQFLTLTVNIGGKPVKRSYTIASTPTQLHYCAITVKREENGAVSRFLNDSIQEGDLLEVAAPNGKFTFTGEEAKSIVLIAGGVGITPMISVIRYLTDMGWHGEIFLLYCCRTTRDFIFREELEQLQERHPNLSVFATMTRAAGTVWMGLKGRFNAEIIGHLVPDVAQRRIHVCGPSTMMAAVVDMLKALKVPDELVKTEAFGPAKKPGAPAPAAPPKPDAQGGSEPAAQTAAPVKVAGATVAFKKSGKSAPMTPDQTVLDVADATGVEIDNSCRSGQCGLCKVKLLSGNVMMDCEDALSGEDKQQGLILACQARASENIEVEA
jgi:glycine betaine catabolism B